jgi:hypothetical protein
VKRDLDSRIQKLKERDDIRKSVDGINSIGKSSGTQYLIAARKQTLAERESI